MEKSKHLESVFTISGRHRFVACVIVVILVSCAAFAYLACCYKQAQEDIVALQRKDALILWAHNDDTAKGTWRETASAK